MATIVDFTLPVEAFPLGDALTAEPEMRIELERIVPTEEGVLPFFWAWDSGDFEGFERRVHEKRAVESLTAVDRVDTGVLYRARWNHAVAGLVAGVTAVEASILEARGTVDGWRFELRFPDRDALRRFRAYAVENEIPLQLRRLYSVTEMRTGEQYDLTEDQRATLVAAYERGYFDDPRRVTQQELADHFGVSQRAISQRIQRGLHRLVGGTLAADR
ncbi:helix-turn-helix domain-containing protein [Halomarina halobia]|uniref:Helix-turn-helix domain-containing protein n=1 Tax=Halomarina halobia TaxID=3033386 RepID=A0ABD6ACS2_9EURY|nr:helix-turn-helix domain-containing protein [Halomarina sp. PSR21]